MGRLFYLVAALLRCASVVLIVLGKFNHRDTENTEATQRIQPHIELRTHPLPQGGTDLIQLHIECMRCSTG